MPRIEFYRFRFVLWMAYAVDDHGGVGRPRFGFSKMQAQGRVLTKDGWF